MFGLFDSLFEPEYDYYPQYQPRRVYQRAPAYEEARYAPRYRPQTAGYDYGYPQEEYTPFYAQPQRKIQRQQQIPRVAKQMAEERPAPKANAAERHKVTVQQSQPAAEKAAMSEDSYEPPKITNRETADPPEVAFKTYRPDNMVAYVPQILTPLSEASRAYLRMHRNAAVISIPFASARTAPELQATGDGLLTARFTGVDGSPVCLQYKLPDFYERGEISARRTDEAYEVTVPLRGDAKDDVVLIQIQ